ncbi:MAG: hypothetical protein E7618_02205 [Ruminococcaceae bacterium]|nr:hypothetical protein [Oscillospiraceae bacterium]
MNSPRKKKERFDLISHSLILSTLARASEYFYDKLPESAVGHLLTGGHHPDGDRLLAKANEKIAFRRRLSIPFKRWMAREFEQSFLLTKLVAFLRSLPLLQLKCLGTFYFAFGLCLSVAYTIERFVLGHTETPLLTILLGLICSAIGGILSTSPKSCGVAFTESRLLSFFLFRVLGIKPAILTPDGIPYGRGDIAFLCGLGLGILGAFTSPLAMTLAIPVLSLLCALFLLPECGVVLIFLVLPFLSTVQIAILTATVTVAWLCKLMRGKRTLSTTAPDLAVFGFGLILLFGGFVSLTPGESLRTALLQCCLLCGFFITVNLIRTSAWVYRCVGALTASLSVTALIGVTEYVLGLSPLNWLDTSMLALIPGRAVSLFGNPNVLAEMLLLTTPFLAVGFLRSKIGDTRLGYGLLGLLSLVCLIFTWSRGGWLAAILIAMVILLLSSRRSLAVLAVCVLCLPLLAALLPTEITTRFLSIFDMTDSSIAYRFGIYEGTNRLLADCLMGESVWENRRSVASIPCIPCKRLRPRRIHTICFRRLPFLSAFPACSFFLHCLLSSSVTSSPILPTVIRMNGRFATRR